MSDDTQIGGEDARWTPLAELIAVAMYHQPLHQWDDGSDLAEAMWKDCVVTAARVREAVMDGTCSDLNDVIAARVDTLRDPAGEPRWPAWYSSAEAKAWIAGWHGALDVIGGF